MLKSRVLCNGFRHIRVNYCIEPSITVDLDTTGMHRQTESHTESLGEKGFSCENFQVKRQFLP